MKKVTKKKQIEDLQTVVAAQWRQINKLKLHLGRLVDIDWTDEQADHDAVIAILDSKEPKPKQLDQSVFDGLDAQWRFAVMQHNGYVILCNQKPFLSFGGSSWDWNGQNIGAGGGYDATNWQNSLIERDKVELTGSDLCRAMLERGDKYVMCFVSGMSDARADSIPKAITSFNLLAGQFRANHDRWQYAVPINNQGAPLTAAEAGL